MPKNNDQIDFESLREFLTITIKPSELVPLLDEIIHNYTILLIESPDLQYKKDSSQQIHYLRGLKKEIEKMYL